jgi:hypothetical protein
VPAWIGLRLPRPRVQRAREPDLRYVASWVSADLKACWQVMECDDERLLRQWMDAWKDLVDFEVVPVLTSAEAHAAVTPRLDDA